MYVVSSNDRIRQGDLIRDVEYRDAYNSGNDLTFDFCVVLTQDCDLEQDINAIQKMEEWNNAADTDKAGKQAPTHDKYLHTVILCPAFAANDLRSGIHMAPLGWTMQNIASSNLWGSIEDNNNARYHFLPASQTFNVPALVLDFKRIYALPRDYVYSLTSNKVAKLNDLFAQAVNNRYASYVSRVALPELDDTGEIQV